MNTKTVIPWQYIRCPQCNSRSKYRRESDGKIVCRQCRCEYEVETLDPE